MGLLTKIFGGPEGGASAGEPASATTPTASPAADAPLPPYTKGAHGDSGIRPALEPQTQRAREATRAAASGRRSEHPRMYLRPSPAAVDPTLPGSTRRQQISVRPAGGRPSLEGRAIEGRAIEGRAIEGRAVEGKALEGKSPEGRRSSEGREASSRAPVPPSRRGLERGASRAAGEAQRQGSQHEPTPPGMRLPRARPRPALVVSPVSLTPEQLALQPGGRQKMPTLVGLGTAIGEVLARGPRGAGDADPASTAGAAGLEAPPAWDEGDAPETTAADVATLAEFALLLSIAPLSSAWADEVRRAIVALQPVASRRQQASLTAVLARLLELLPGAAPPSPIIGEPRERLVHELTRLAGLLPEWPARAQDLAEEARRREARIVRELLLAIDGTRRDQRARLEQQVRLDVLGGMTAEALAQELAAPVERGQELRAVLDAYFEQRRAAEPDPGRRRGLASALGRLDAASREFDEADPERKDVQRALRSARRDAMSAVNVVLAERGEHEWLDLLEPLSVSERVERLKQWLSAEGEGGAEGPSTR